jgi:hypothetical protein
MYARLSGARQAGTRHQRRPSVAARGKPDLTEYLDQAFRAVVTALRGLALAGPAAAGP